MVRERTLGSRSGSTAGSTLEAGSRLLAQGRAGHLIRLLGYKMGFQMATTMTTNHFFTARTLLSRTTETPARTTEDPSALATGLSGVTDLRQSAIIDLMVMRREVMTDAGLGPEQVKETEWVNCDLMVPMVEMRTSIFAAQTVVWEGWAIIEFEVVKVATRTVLAAYAAAGIDPSDFLHGPVQSS